MPAPRDHADHDRELVAAYAAGDAEGAGLAAAEALVAGCAECALLHRDLRALAAALAAAPAPARPRDFRLGAAQAAAARRPSGLRGLLAPLASGRLSLAGPAAASLAALGVAGVLLSGGVRLGAGSAATSALATAAPAGAVSGAAGAGGGPGDLGAVASGAAVTSDQQSASASAGPRPSVPTTAPGPVASRAPLPAATMGQAIGRSDAVPSGAPVITQIRAIEIAIAARPLDGGDQVLGARLETFGKAQDPSSPINGARPADRASVWTVTLGWRLGPLDGQGAIVIIDATDGHIIQAYDWIS